MQSKGNVPFFYYADLSSINAVFFYLISMTVFRIDTLIT